MVTPTQAEVIGELQRLCRDELELERTLAATDRLEGDLQLDSMGLIVVVVGLENRFRIKLTETDSEEVRTVGDLAALVVRRSLEGAR